MGFSWTDAQQGVIDVRDCNLLVSAAAGSGKTAVLVERICQRIMDTKNPCSIDELLVVTFTKAAAGEMRGRITQALEERLAQEPENVHLQKQVILSHNAQVTTIDGFCYNLLREHFYLLDMEPGFQIIDENEEKLLMEDVFDEVLNQFYKERSPEFVEFVENYCTGKQDEIVADFVFSMYKNAMSHPWPLRWLEHCRESYKMVGIEENPMVKQAWKESRNILKDCVCALEEGISEIKDYTQLDKLNDDLTNVMNALRTMASLESFEEMFREMQRFSFANMPRISAKDEDVAEAKEYAKGKRDWVKKQVQSLISAYYSQTYESIDEDRALIYPMMEVLCNLTESFMTAFQSEKQKKNRLDFSDIEHMALSILVDENGIETDVARECQKQYKEIMIDEYQDSNLLQEYILSAVSTCNSGKNNIFMVGDVKQSIYRFRLARPDMFIEKYNRYPEADVSLDVPERKILLDQNFRSRKEVLQFCNDVFTHLMQPNLGDIDYDEKAALKVGAAYKDGSKEQFGTEVILVNEESYKESGASKEKMEALAIAARIKDEIKNGVVTDKATGELRPTEYGDIVVLSRSTVWWDTLKEVLSQEKIPALVTGNTGYFDSIEIITILALLQTIDNRMQDIPLTAVLTSPIGGLRKEDLACIRTAYPKERFSKACMLYAKRENEDDNEEIKCKLNKLYSLVDELKRRSGYEPVYELLEDIYDMTGYYALVGAMPQGQIRMQNLDILVEKAYTYENSSYHGLYHFLRYVDKIRKYEIDFPLSSDSTTMNAVRIMTIHKSKGLEFPVVIVGGLSRQFNQMDIRARLITHPEYGAALEVTDGRRRIRRQGFFKNSMKNVVQKETLAEEIRVLYVALTRAKEHLILTGTVKNREYVEDILKQQNKSGVALTYTEKLRSKSFMEWLLKILASYQNEYSIKVVDDEELNVDLITSNLEENQRKPWFLENLSMKELGIADKEQEDSLSEQEAVLRELSEIFGYEYPYEAERNIRLKMSVSDIKHRFMEDIFLRQESEPEEVPDFLQEERKKIIPAFVTGEEQKEGSTEVNPGALRGTAYHRVLECMDFSQKEYGTECNNGIVDVEAIQQEILRQVDAGLLTKDMAQLVQPEKIQHLMSTTLFSQIHQAAQAGKLYKEQPFVMGITPREAGLGEGEAIILVQGIIDLFWEENGKITLLDYKTDKVRSGEELIKRYQKQMELYSDAIERATGKKVERIVLYSFALEEVIDVMK